MAIEMGVIGPGLMWHKSHKPVMDRLSAKIKIAAICARSQSTLDAAGVPHARQYTDINALLSDKNIEAVMVLTPIGLNAPTAIAALKAGKHVFLEKPMGASVRECRELMAAEKASGRHVYVLEQNAYSAPLAAMKQILSENRIGDLVLYNRIEHGMLDADKNDAGGYGKTSWRQKPDFPLGGLFDGGIHAIAELTQLFGAPTSVSASGRKWRKGFGEYDEILMNFAYPSGLRGVFSHASAMPWVQCGFTVFGTAGVMHPAGNMLQIYDLSAKNLDLEINQKDHIGMWEQLLAAYESNAPAPYTSYKAAQDVAILEAVALSIKSHKEVAIEKIAAI